VGLSARRTSWPCGKRRRVSVVNDARGPARPLQGPEGGEGPARGRVSRTSPRTGRPRRVLPPRCPAAPARGGRGTLVARATPGTSATDRSAFHTSISAGQAVDRQSSEGRALPGPPSMLVETGLPIDGRSWQTGKRSAAVTGQHRPPYPDRVRIEFDGEVWFWKGPSPFHFVTIPEAECREIKAASSAISYGWGVIPVTVRLGATESTTPLFPHGGALFG